jgi:hypothetical protein
MNSSEQINEIAAAISKAQATLVNPIKSSVNPHFKSKYADLASGLEIVRKELSAVGVAVLQPTIISDNGTLISETRLVHSSGQWVASHWPIGPFTPDQQKMGSASTYARRYGLFSLVGIAGDADDDGNEASKPEPAAVKIGRADAELIDSGCEMLGEPFRKGLFAKLKVERAADILQQDRDYVVKLINDRLERRSMSQAAE